MTVENTLDQREKTYGSFKNHSVLSQNLKAVLINSPKYWTLKADQREALEMIQHKIARILNGNPDYTDSWHDIQGYAKLVEDRLVKESASATE